MASRVDHTWRELKGASFYGNDVETVAQGLANRGCYALIVNYRLAPCGLIPGRRDTPIDYPAGRLNKRMT